MSLSHLSIYRVGGHRDVPQVQTNEQRMQKFRARLPVQFGNSTFNYSEELMKALSDNDHAEAGRLLALQMSDL